ncbi:hypothetical protein BC938DRAFT_474454 [Jimgerdemannia flammicorona]|uniref:Zn(2)-C6 fungal-type domain-containing protein n=1 Tax=Jimgerdemannia flammicorona TaxID=994334 RepID=A0A433Q2A6_9FUNG|nr:hypothetical protein BC938DRAFT_474454 [Jimgerdemannia flammicorona]
MASAHQASPYPAAVPWTTLNPQHHHHHHNNHNHHLLDTHHPHIPDSRSSRGSLDYLNLNPKQYMRNNPLPVPSGLPSPNLPPTSMPFIPTYPSTTASGATSMAASGRPYVHRPKNVQTDRYEDAETSSKEGNVVNLMAVKSIEHYNHKGDAGPRAYVYQEPVKMRVSTKKGKRRTANGADLSDDAGWNGSGNDQGDDNNEAERSGSVGMIIQHIDGVEDARKQHGSAFRVSRRDGADRSDREKGGANPKPTHGRSKTIMIIEENPPPPVYSPPPPQHHNLVFRTHTVHNYARGPQVPGHGHGHDNPAADPVVIRPQHHPHHHRHTDHAAPRSPLSDHQHARPVYNHNPSLNPALGVFPVSDRVSPAPAAKRTGPRSMPRTSPGQSHPQGTFRRAASTSSVAPSSSASPPSRNTPSPSPDVETPLTHSRKNVRPSAPAAPAQQTLFTVFSQLPTKTDRNRKATSLADISKRFWVYKCTRCRRMKQKCDVGSPKCWRCERAGVECDYPKERPPGWKVSRNMMGRVGRAGLHPGMGVMGLGRGTSEEEDEEEYDDEDDDDDHEHDHDHDHDHDRRNLPANEARHHHQQQQQQHHHHHHHHQHHQHDMRSASSDLDGETMSRGGSLDGRETRTVVTLAHTHSDARRFSDVGRDGDDEVECAYGTPMKYDAGHSDRSASPQEVAFVAYQQQQRCVMEIDAVVRKEKPVRAEKRPGKQAPRAIKLDSDSDDSRGATPADARPMQQPFDGLREEERWRGREGERVFRFTAWQATSPTRRQGKAKRKRDERGEEEERRVEAQGTVEARPAAPVQPVRSGDDDERRFIEGPDVKVEGRIGGGWIDVEKKKRARETKELDRQLVLRRPWVEEGFESPEEDTEDDDDDEPRTEAEDNNVSAHAYVHVVASDRPVLHEPADDEKQRLDLPHKSYHDTRAISLLSLRDGYDGVHTADYSALEKIAERMVAEQKPYMSAPPLSLLPPAPLPSRPAYDGLWTLASSATLGLPSPPPSFSPPPTFHPASKQSDTDLDRYRLSPPASSTQPLGHIILPPPSTLLSSGAFRPVVLGNVAGDPHRVPQLMELSVQQMQPKESDLRSSMRNVEKVPYRNRAWELA